jgi:catechol 2,3-dioxygenase-like lactoylglutathione lyase family enzyme
LINNKVTLYSHVWDEMRSFYVDVLGFELLLQTDDGFEIKAGESMLEIKKYHQRKAFLPFCHEHTDQFIYLGKSMGEIKSGIDQGR